MGVIMGESDISRYLGAAKLQSAPGAVNPRYTQLYSPVLVAKLEKNL